MDNFSEFLEMGGYASYIWPVYGLMAVFMLGILVQSLKRWKDNEKELKLLQQVNKSKNI